MSDGETVIPEMWWQSYFSPLYHKVYSGPLFDADATEADAEYLAEVFADAQQGTLLDLGCGFGRHLRLLKRRGFNVFGLDRFRHLLQAQLRRGRRVAQADLRAVPFKDGAFAGAYCLLNTFGYFSDAENEATLREWARVVRPGGKLVLQIPNRPGMMKVIEEFPPSQMIVHGLESTEQYGYDEESKQMLGAGVWRTEDGEQAWTFKLRLYTRAEIERLLKKAGFQITEIFEDSEQSPFNPRESSEMVLVAQRA